MNDEWLLELVARNSNNSIVLERLPELGVNDTWLVSGCLFQTAWNAITSRPPNHGVKDYDVFYFDDSDLTWEAEDVVIKSAEILFKDLDIQVEVRNQARVHLWYEQHFGIPYQPLKCSRDGIDRFLATACMVGLQPGKHTKLYAPAGLEDLKNLVLRPNLTPNFSTQHFEAKAGHWQSLWPELQVKGVTEGRVRS